MNNCHLFEKKVVFNAPSDGNHFLTPLNWRHLPTLSKRTVGKLADDTATMELGPCWDLQGDPKKMPPTQLFIKSIKIQISNPSLVCSVLSLCMIILQSFRSVGRKALEWGSFEEKMSKTCFHQKALLNCIIRNHKSQNLPTPPREMLEIGSYCFGFAIPTLKG